MRPSSLPPLSTPSWIALAALLLAFVVLPVGDVQPSPTEPAVPAIAAAQD